MTERKNRIKEYAVFLWRRVTRHWVMKLCCAALAFGIWQEIRENTSFEMLVTDVPVTISAGQHWAVMDQSVETVNIHFRGAREDLRFISRDDLQVQIDIPRSGIQKQTIKFQSHYVRASSRVQIVQFDPPDITVTIDREVECVLPVKAVFDGELPAGIQLEKSECTPATVRVRGAEQLLRDLELVRTVPVNLDGRYNSFSAQATIADAREFWNATPERVSVDVTLTERVMTRQFDRIAIRFLGSAENSNPIRIAPEFAAVQLSGGSAEIEKLTPADIYLYVDCSALPAAGEYELPVHAYVPAGYKAERIEPAVVKVTVKKL